MTPCGLCGQPSDGRRGHPRCEGCRTARAQPRLTRSEAQLARPWRGRIAPDDLQPCGTVAAYRRGCRCDECVAAKRAYARANHRYASAESIADRRTSAALKRAIYRATHPERGTAECRAKIADGALRSHLTRPELAITCDRCGCASVTKYTRGRYCSRECRRLAIYEQRVRNGKHAESHARRQRRRADARDAALAEGLGL